MRILLNIVIAAALVSPAWAEDARDIVVRSLETKTNTYVGEQVTEIVGPQGGRVGAQRQRVFRKGDRLRILFLNTRQELVDDGTQSLLYMPRLEVVEEGPSRLDVQREKAQKKALRSGRVTAELLPDSEVAGRPTYVVSLTPARAGGQPRKVWIDKQNYVQLRMDEPRPGGRTFTTYFTSIDFQTEPTAAQLALTAPHAAQRVPRGYGRPIPPIKAAAMARAWGGLLEPRLVPTGYVLRGFYRHQFKGQPVLVAVYGREGEKNVLSVFQGPAMGMGGMVDRRRGKLQVVSAQKGKADVMLVAPLPEEDLQKVMDSFQ